MRLLAKLDLRQFEIHPKPVIGFSDITVLHAALVHAGWLSVHGPTVTQIGRLPGEDLAHLFNLLESPTPPAPWTCRPLAAGRAAGPLVGGNLELVTRLLGTPHLPPLDGAILALEDTGERPYRLDRSLTQLGLAGIWRRVAGVVVGQLTGCSSDPPSPPSADEVVAERLGRLGIPVVVGADFGHGARNLAFAHGGQVVLDGSAGTVTFIDGAVK
jgi:muramoyltetrapeptide carboxypeptidase